MSLSVEAGRVRNSLSLSLSRSLARALSRSLALALSRGKQQRGMTSATRLGARARGKIKIQSPSSTTSKHRARPQARRLRPHHPMRPSARHMAGWSPSKSRSLQMLVRTLEIATCKSKAYTHSTSRQTHRLSGPQNRPGQRRAGLTTGSYGQTICMIYCFGGFGGFPKTQDKCTRSEMGRIRREGDTKSLFIPHAHREFWQDGQGD